jgi:hypothetical protein
LISKLNIQPKIEQISGREVLEIATQTEVVAPLIAGLKAVRSGRAETLLIRQLWQAGHGL